MPCENIQIRFPIPESLVYMFRVEKRFRYGSVHSSRKKPGRIKGLERLTMFASGGAAGGGGGAAGAGGGGAGGGGPGVPGSTPIVLQASSGLAKYEHLHRAVVWRISRLPERNQGRSAAACPAVVRYDTLSFFRWAVREAYNGIVMVNVDLYSAIITKVVPSVL